MSNMQEQGHPEGYDYAYGSPHLKHPHLKRLIESSLLGGVERIVAESGACSVLEIGGGHGAFSGVLRTAGASVTITEMSAPSTEHLRLLFGSDPGVSVVYDPAGTWLTESNQMFDLVVCISVLHHIPDYEATTRQAVARIRAGGEFQSWQDPPYYPAMTRRDRWAMHSSYFVWRLHQGNLLRGIRTRLRRIQGILDETNPADMVEYHVVRKGVDEGALERLLRPEFEDVKVVRYWSAQGRRAQRWGDRLGLRSSFGLIARHRKAAPVSDLTLG